jgi:hypothetical protein
VLRNRRLRTLLCCLALQAGTIAGVHMRPEQIRDLLHTLNNPKVAQTDPEQKPAGGDPEAGETPTI